MFFHLDSFSGTPHAYLCQQLISPTLQVFQFARSLISLVQVVEHDALNLLNVLLGLLQAARPILLLRP